MKRILVAGAGHGGLTAAYNLSKAGYDVTVIESKKRENLGYDWHDALEMSAFTESGIPCPPESMYTPGVQQVFTNPSATVKIPLPFIEGAGFNMDRKVLINYLDVPVELTDGREVNAMVYIMNLRMNFGMPSTHYYRTVHQGYLDCKLDTSVLNKALGESAQRFYSSAVGLPSMQMRMNFPKDEPTEDEIDEDYDEEDDIVDEPDEDMDESDPFYFSDGMHW